MWWNGLIRVRGVSICWIIGVLCVTRIKIAFCVCIKCMLHGVFLLIVVCCCNRDVIMMVVSVWWGYV